MRTGEGFGGKTALVTGAAGDMGLEVSRRLCGEKARVYGVDTGAPGSGGTPAGAVFEIGDAGDEGLMSALAARAVEETGRLDHLVNAAGVLWFDRDTSLASIDPGVWDEVLRINLTAAMIATRAVLPHLRRHGGSMVRRSAIAATTGPRMRTRRRRRGSSPSRNRSPSSSRGTVSGPTSSFPAPPARRCSGGGTRIRPRSGP